MDNIKLYEISPAYIDYLVPFVPHLFQNKQTGQQNERKLKISGPESALTRRCNDFAKLEALCLKYHW